VDADIQEGFVVSASLVHPNNFYLYKIWTPYSTFKILRKEEDYETVENYEQVEDYIYIINCCKFRHSGTKASEEKAIINLLIIYFRNRYL
jgi:hypothetical protein